MSRRILVVWMLLVSAGFELPAQEKNPQDKPGQEPKSGSPATMKLYDVPPAREVEAQSPDEVASYFKITQTEDPGERVKLIEEFLKQYPDSKYNPTLHQMAGAAYQQLNNYEKLVEHGEKTLEKLPASPALLSVLAMAYAYHGEADKAIDRASRSITLLEKLTIPANVDAAKFNAERNQYLASNYTSLGNAFLTKFEAARRSRQQSEAAAAAAAGAKTDPSAPVAPATAQGTQKPVEPASASASSADEKAVNLEAIHLAKSQGYLTRALELNPNYELAQFQIGVVYAYQNKANEAMQAFARSIGLGGNFAEMGRQNLEAIYKITHKNSLEGLDEFIAKANTLDATANPPATK
jgi:tetratricopeptide (TPR) repeat protein